MPQSGQSQADDIDVRLLTTRPKLRLRPVIVFVACIAVLAALSYFKPQPYRAFYGGLAALATFTLVVQYRRETALIRNHRVSATAIVTEYKVTGKHAPYFGKGVPIIQYEFVSFDQKTYRGETGWGAAGLSKGSHITVLYDSRDPARSHPLRGFVFYSFDAH